MKNESLSKLIYRTRNATNATRVALLRARLDDEYDKLEQMKSEQYEWYVQRKVKGLLLPEKMDWSHLLCNRTASARIHKQYEVVDFIVKYIVKFDR